MQIVDISFFMTYLHIPLSVNDPNSSVTPNNTKELSDLCVKLEREILLNALGSSEALTEVTINEPAKKFKKLIQGDEYDDKIWLGLDNTDSLIATFIKIF
jgi:hypothetical protein